MATMLGMCHLGLSSLPIPVSTFHSTLPLFASTTLSLATLHNSLVTIPNSHNNPQSRGWGIPSLDDGGSILRPWPATLSVVYWMGDPSLQGMALGNPLDYSQLHGPLSIPIHLLSRGVCVAITSTDRYPYLSFADVSRYLVTVTVTGSHIISLHGLLIVCLCGLLPHFHVVRFCITICTNMVHALVCAHP